MSSIAFLQQRMTHTYDTEAVLPWLSLPLCSPAVSSAPRFLRRVLERQTRRTRPQMLADQGSPMGYTQPAHPLQLSQGWSLQRTPSIFIVDTRGVAEEVLIHTDWDTY